MQNTIRNSGGVPAEKAQTNEIVTLQPKPTNSFGRWKPTIYWYTPILMVLAAVVLVGGLTALIRKLARRFEKEKWSDEVREQSYSARPFSSSDDSTGAGPG
ncbi:MAG: hypothetical protein VYC32_03995 [Planctomycetota bacterium]|nr:hypothetical protein [Planctomycetota bacterium]MEE3296943.1 hypothetical protein [Planctomycetota bacterium]|tara:strand:+ start:108 stop:410 length:303 start_codon:yes stop_codon:yes gene_type:complete